MISERDVSCELLNPSSVNSIVFCELQCGLFGGYLCDEDEIKIGGVLSDGP